MEVFESIYYLKVEWFHHYTCMSNPHLCKRSQKYTIIVQKLMKFESS